MLLLNRQIDYLRSFFGRDPIYFTIMEYHHLTWFIYYWHNQNKRHFTNLFEKEYTRFNLCEYLEYNQNAPSLLTCFYLSNLQCPDNFIYPFTYFLFFIEYLSCSIYYGTFFVMLKVQLQSMFGHITALCFAYTESRHIKY